MQKVGPYMEGQARNDGITGPLTRSISSAIAIAALVLGGCAPRASVVLNSTPYTANVPVERLLVHLDLASWGMPPELYGQLETTLAGTLAACHVTPRIWRTDPANPDDAARFHADVAAFQPSAILTIKAAEHHFDGTQPFIAKAFLRPQPPPHTNAGPVVEGFAMLILIMIGLAATRSPHETLLSNLTLFDSASAAPIWQARSEFRFVPSNNMPDLFKQFGVLSVGIVARLRDDGVLKQCPVDLEIEFVSTSRADRDHGAAAPSSKLDRTSSPASSSAGRTS
jgi:hypothetical protein